MQLLLKESLPITLLIKEESVQEFYEGRIYTLLEKILPLEFFQKPLIEKEHFIETFLPQLHWEEGVDSHRLIILAPAQKYIKSFLLEILSHWIQPGLEKNLHLFLSVDFEIQEPKKAFSFFEIAFPYESEEAKEIILKNIPSLDTEIRLGLSSEYHAHRILEFKGVSFDRKMSMIQDKIASIMRTHSKDFGQSIYSEMQHFLVTASEEFKKERDHHHISRIISVLFFIGQMLRQKIHQYPNERHIYVKVVKATLTTQEKPIPVLGLIVGLNFLHEQEVFEKKHLIRAIKHYFPHIKVVENSYVCHHEEKENFETLYLEITPENETEFTFEEIKKIKVDLPHYLKNHINHLTYPIFMPRNEEEILRNIAILSRQVKSTSDLPHVMINFDEQKEGKLAFTVIVLRLLKPSYLNNSSLFKLSQKFTFELERSKKIGIIRRKYIKEASVFRVYAPIENYLRHDHTLDLNYARQDLLSDLIKILGEVRDFNGGMISKQNEAYKLLKTTLKNLSLDDEILLEKYFYSIRPAAMTVVREPKYLESLFGMLTNSVKKVQDRSVSNTPWFFKQESKAIHILIPSSSEEKKQKIDAEVEKLEILSSEILSFHIPLDGMHYFGYSYFSEDPSLQKKFLQTIQSIL
jgi:hypothetical protein